MNDASSIRAILDFWFLAHDHPEHGKRREVWWQSTPEFDEEIRVRFGGLLDPAIAGQLDAWRRSPGGALALVLLCDQLPRNMHRRTARAFAGDAKARESARHAVGRGYPAAFPKDMRLFFFMPFQHSENLGDQDFACSLFATLEDPESDKYALEHREVIARFGRFPHRNEVLGRTSTKEELEYLRSAKRYGQ